MHGTPQEAAQGLLQAMPEEELLAEVYRDRVLTLVPLNDKGSLAPEAEAVLKAKYLRWCQPRGGGDCLGLFTDGPYLRTDDRRPLALALAFGGVLDETRAALGRELSPQALLSSLVWAAGLYRGRWIERQVANRFPHLSWNSRGVDVTGPGGQSYHYEILSGTESNFALHGRRMASTFFRMIFF
ncbi:hypothetical protein ACN28S_18795 [Cystobacter fuscus]